MGERGGVKWDLRRVGWKGQKRAGQRVWGVGMDGKAEKREAVKAE